MTSLFDLNVLIAMFDEEHIHYERAHRWWGTNRRAWLGIMPGHAEWLCPCGLATKLFQFNSHELTLIALLRRALSHRDHTFWPDDLSIADPAHFDHTHIRGPKQLTDVYLLALAVKNGGRLVTMDSAISVAAVPKAGPLHLVVI